MQQTRELFNNLHEKKVEDLQNNNYNFNIIPSDDIPKCLIKTKLVKLTYKVTTHDGSPIVGRKVDIHVEFVSDYTVVTCTGINSTGVALHSVDNLSVTDQDGKLYFQLKPLVVSRKYFSSGVKLAVTASIAGIGKARHVSSEPIQIISRRKVLSPQIQPALYYNLQS